MKITIDPNLPQIDDMQALKQRLTELFRAMALQINQSSEGSIQAAYNALPAPPAQGSYRAGDAIRNSAIGELGAAGSKYMITHWICVTGGAPGAWLGARSLTGN